MMRVGTTGSTRWMGWMIGALCLSVLGTSAAETETLTLTMGSSRKLEVPDGIRKLYISNPSIIEARPDDDGYAVLVTSTKPGKTELRISRLNLNDRVVKIEVEPELRELADEIAGMLEDVEGLNVKVLGDQIVLDGELLTQTSSRRAQEVADAFPGRVTNLTKLDIVSYTRNVKRALEKEINIETVEIKVDGGRLLLLGTVPTAEELERVKEIAKKRAENVTILLQVAR